MTGGMYLSELILSCVQNRAGINPAPTESSHETLSLRHRRMKPCPYGIVA